ncbi:MAG: dihydrolipoyl dehydrogenase [Rhodospirillaceae bacterium]|nr:dihydrolipoyl dehydrogenase [Rhodospirillaceae bacterium]
MNDTRYDVVVIGAGPGGYVCAIRAAQLGLKTACVESRETLGGTCLNVGCIPSKALLQASEHFDEAKHHFADFGIKTGDLEVDLSKMMDKKDKVVSTLTKGVEGLFKKNKVTWLKGEGRITGKHQVTVRGSDGSTQSVQTENIVIATGSVPVSLPGIKVDEKRIVSSTGALSLDKVPEKLIIVGSGYIGLELGSVWRRLGAEVTVLEFLDHICPTMDRTLGKQYQRLLERQGFKFELSARVTGATAGKKNVKVTVKDKDGNDSERDADVVLVAVGRRAFTDGLGVDDAGVTSDEKGRIDVDAHFRSNIPNIYAIGDVIQGPMLAHKAEDEGVAVAEIIAGQAGHVNYGAIPSVVYTEPEAAWVGKTEEEVKASGVAYKVGTFNFRANGRALTLGSVDGLVKIIADKATDRVLGVHILGHDASSLIGEAVLAMEYGASAEDIARTCHAHPTLSEAVKEAAMDVDKRAIHS